MTTVPRPTFEPARGGQEGGEEDFGAIFQLYSSGDMPPQPKYNFSFFYEEHDQGRIEELQNRDFRTELEEREQGEKEKGSSHRAIDLSIGPTTSSTKKRKLDPVTAAILDADVPFDDLESDSDREDFDDTVLLVDVLKIITDRATERIKKGMLDIISLYIGYGQRTIEELQNRDFRTELEEREQGEKEKGSSHRAIDLSIGPTTSSTKRRKLDQVPAASLDADDTLDDEESDPDSDEDDIAALLCAADAQRIEIEQAAEKIKKDMFEYISHYRGLRQDIIEELRNLDYRNKLEERVREEKEKESSRRAIQPSREPTTSSTKRRKLGQVPAAILDADDPFNNLESDSGSEDYDIAVLLVGVLKILTGNAAEQIKKEMLHVISLLRGHGQCTIEELRNRDFRTELEEREQGEKEKGSSHRAIDLSIGPTTSSTKRRKLDPVPAASLDADDTLDDEVSDPDSDEDDIASLLANAQRIKIEQAAGQIKKEMFQYLSVYTGFRQDIIEELRNLDYRNKLEERVREEKEKESSRRAIQPSREPTTSSTKRRKLDQVPAASLNADDPFDDLESDSDSEDYDIAMLLVDVLKILTDDAAKQIKKEMLDISSPRRGHGQRTIEELRYHNFGKELGERGRGEKKKGSRCAVDLFKGPTTSSTKRQKLDQVPAASLDADDILDDEESDSDSDEDDIAALLADAQRIKIEQAAEQIKKEMFEYISLYTGLRQDIIEELQNLDYRKKLEERVREEKEKGSSRRVIQPSREPTTSSTKRQELVQVPAANLNAAITKLQIKLCGYEAALAELLRIKKEGIAAQKMKEMEERQQEERIRMENVLSGDSLLDYSSPSGEEWDDSIVDLSTF